VQQIAEQRAADRAIAAGREVRRQRRSAAMRASWARRRGVADDADDPSHSDAPNTHACARTSSALTAYVQKMRDRRLCGARTRAGLPCVRRVMPGKQRCVCHGGASTGPKTEAGKAKIAAAQRARWAHFRQERGAQPNQGAGTPT
jgi:hypothetical protein